MAWYAEPGKYLESPKNIDCLLGSLNLVKGATKAGLGRFVGIGTCFEYDLLPMQSVEFAWCCLFYLYGDAEDSRRLVPYLRSKFENGEVAKLTSGKQIRDYLDVADAGKMVADCALSDMKGSVNICSGVAVTVRQLAERLADEFGRRDLLFFGARTDNVMDPPCVLGKR